MAQRLKNLTFDFNLLLAPTRAHQVFICICFVVVIHESLFFSWVLSHAKLYIYCKTIYFAYEIYRTVCVSLCLCSFLTLTKCLPITESHKNTGIYIIVLRINPLDYSQIISCLISLFCRISNQLLLVTRGKRLQGAYH